MLVRVHYKNGKYDYVHANAVEGLIETGAIHQLCRSAGWATVGVDPIRSKGSGLYTGPERRGMQRAPSLALALIKQPARKTFSTALVILTIALSVIVGTVISAILMKPADVDDRYSQTEIDGYARDPIPIPAGTVKPGI